MDYQELNSVWAIKLQYDRALARLQDLRVLAEPTTPKLDGMPHAPAQSSKVETIATLIVETEKTLGDLATQIEREKFLLLSKLQTITMRDLPHRVMSYHYVACLSFNAIAKLMAFSRRYIVRLHDEAIRSLGLNVQTMIAFKKSMQFTACPA